MSTATEYRDLLMRFLPHPIRSHADYRRSLVQLERLMDYPMVRERVEAGKISLHGWHYVIEEGEVHVFDVRTGDFIAASQASNSGTGPYHHYVEHDGQVLAD